MEYKEEISSKLDKLINDELTAAIVYFRMAESLVGSDTENVSKELKEHGQEEFEHFTQLLSFAYNHGVVPKITFNEKKVNTAPSNLKEVVKFTQELEQIAIDDYKELSSLAKDNEDLESHSFFMELMNDEIEHFDDLAYVLGQKREIKESYNAMSISDIIGE